MARPGPKDNAEASRSIPRFMMRAVYPGSFNPPTIGHVAIMEAALASYSLTSLDVVVSKRALAKPGVSRPALEHRLEVIEASVAHLSRVHVRVTDLQLIADIASGYDVVVMGADKWNQVNDVVFYRDATHRDGEVARLPTLAIAARDGQTVPDFAELLVEADIGHVSSTAARDGASDQMTRAARLFDEHTGAWSDPDRYDALPRRER